MKNIIIVCAGGYALEVYSVINEINRLKKLYGKEPAYNLLGFINDIPDALEGKNVSVGILGTIKDWQPTDNEVYAMGLADSKSKVKVAELLKARGAKFETLVAPWSAVADLVEMGEGCFVTAYQINAGVKLGNFVNVNGSMIDVGAEIGDYSTTTGFTNIGNSKIGKRVFIGSHAVVDDGVTVGDDAFISVGTVVTKDVEPGVKLFGNPAQKVEW